MGSIKHDYPLENKTLTKNGEECRCLPRNLSLLLPSGTIRSLTPDPTKIIYAKSGNLKRVPGGVSVGLDLLGSGKISRGWGVFENFVMYCANHRVEGSGTPTCLFGVVGVRCIPCPHRSPIPHKSTKSNIVRMIK